MPNKAIHIKRQLKRAKNAPRFAKRHLRRVLRSSVAKANTARQKTRLARGLIMDKNKRLFLIYRKKAERLEKQKDWEKAANIWLQLIKTFGKNTPVEAPIRISQAYRKLGYYNDALRIIDEAISWYPAEKHTTHATDQDTRNWLKLSSEKAEINFLQLLNNIEEYRSRIKDYLRQRKKRNKNQLKIAVFSAVSGGYDTIKPPVVIDPRLDYILFTDCPIKTTDIFDVRPLPYIDADPVRSARFVKTHPHFVLKEYDVAVWIDANIMITGEIYSIVENVLKSGKVFGAMHHPVRKSPYEEMDICIRQGRDNEDIIKEQKEFYKKQNYNTDQLIESNVLVYDLRTSTLDPFLNEWWNQIDKFSRRDQLSINYAVDKHGIKWKAFTEPPNTARNHPALAMTDHITSGSEAYKQLMEDLKTKSVVPDKGKAYIKVKHKRLAEQQTDITVVVPIHNALEDVKNCLNSIKKHHHKKLKLILIDDGSDKNTMLFLSKFSDANKNWTSLVRHEKALGYTKSANEGLKKSKAEFTIILNSDTIVTKDWAQKMADVAFSNKGVGIVGPLSSAASHQSVPNHKSSEGQTAINTLPAGLNVEDMNRYCEEWSYSGSIPLTPLVHGFCFGVTRRVIETIGFFDETRFPRGYGEENDYCFRATEAGFNLAVATNTYVFHAKSKSFISDERKKLMDEGMATLHKLHGRSRIERSVKTMQNNSILVELREKFEKLYHEKKS